MPFKFALLAIYCSLLLLSGQSHAQESNAAVCFEQKNKACLGEIYKDIFANETPEKIEAIYLHGMLFLEDENYEGAKKQFEMGVMFGDSPRSKDKYVELINSGKVEVEAFDCMAIGSEKCLINVAESNPDKAKVAFYHLAGLLSKSDATRAAEYTIKSAELGHKTAACLLSYGYSHEKANGPSAMAGFVPELPKDFAKARAWGEECGHGPFVGFNEEYFNKYKAASGHKAFAKTSYGYGVFLSDIATREYAASLAAVLCNMSATKQPTGEKCKVVNVDGEWVDYYVPEPMPDLVGGIDDLIYLFARVNFDKYDQAAAPKVLVQGVLGNWAWDYGKPDASIEEVTRIAVAKCQKDWRYSRFGSECNVINLNGDWLK